MEIKRKRNNETSGEGKIINVTTNGRPSYGKSTIFVSLYGKSIV